MFEVGNPGQTILKRGEFLQELITRSGSLEIVWLLFFCLGLYSTRDFFGEISMEEQ